MKPRYASALALFLSLATLLRAAGPEPPDTPQGARMKALLAAFAVGTPDAVRAFISANFAPSALQQMPLEQRVQRLSGIVAQTGPLEYHSILRPSDTEPVYLVRSRDGWMELGMMLDASAGYGVRGLRFDESEGPGAVPETRRFGEP